MTDLVSCAHCESKGTCQNAEESNSCQVCKRHHKVADTSGASVKGLVCSVCEGWGAIETKTARIKNRVAPMLALIIVYVVLCMIWTNLESPHFDKLLAFGGTLIGSIVGYYFGGKSQ